MPPSQLIPILLICGLWINPCWCRPRGDHRPLTGSDFLAVFMRSREPPTPSTPARTNPSGYYYRHHNNVFEDFDFEIEDDQDEDGEREEEEGGDTFESYKLDAQRASGERDDEVGLRGLKSSTPPDESPIPLVDDQGSTFAVTQDQTSTTEQPTTTISQDLTTSLSSREFEGKEEGVGNEKEGDDEASAVVSVRVSSSVVRSKPSSGVEAYLTSLQEQPPVTAAVQRSHLGVEEGTSSIAFVPPSHHSLQSDQAIGREDKMGDGEKGSREEEATRYDRDGDRVSYSEEHTVYRVEGRRRTGAQPPLQSPDSSAEASSVYGSQPQEREKKEILLGGRGEIGIQSDVGPGYDPSKSPVVYRTSVSTATSGSRVEFYREPPGIRRLFQPPSQQTPPPSHSLPPRPIPVPQLPKNYEEPERIYQEPERNYEVDEAVSVGSQGRVHGVQDGGHPPGLVKESEDQSQNQPPKFGYVVEGRNFRKYRVEERTSDGFIVGEYGVVSHDDGSLRGVRYTADSNINPRLIYDALVKFLSLK